MRNKSLLSFIPILVATVLAGCGAPDEVDFCAAYARAALARDADAYSLADWRISDRHLGSLEAQRTVFPNYDPQAHFKQRPDNIPLILNALAIMDISLRKVELSLTPEPTAAGPAHHETCRFLLVNGHARDISAIDLTRFIMDRTQDDRAGTDGGCCIRTRDDVR